MDLTVFNLETFTVGVTVSLVSYLSIYFVINGVKNLLDRLTL